MTPKLLLEHLKNNRDSLLSLSNYVSLAHHNGNLGTMREGLISQFLEQNLPEFVRYHSGEIFDNFGERSGQIDIVLHPITSPKLHLHGSINLFPTQTVLSAIEVKSNLDKADLGKAIHGCIKLKKLNRYERQQIVHTNNGSIDLTTVPFILFGYTGPTIDTLITNIQEVVDDNEIELKRLPDLILVLDKGYYLERHLGIADPKPINDFYIKVEEPDKVLLGIFIYLMRLIEFWSSNPSITCMRISEYVKDFTQVTGHLNLRAGSLTS